MHVDCTAMSQFVPLVVTVGTHNGILYISAVSLLQLMTKLICLDKKLKETVHLLDGH